MSSFGQIVLCLSMVMSALGGAAVLAGRKSTVRKAGERFLLSAAASAGCALFILAFLLLNHDYRNAYVYDNADRNMSIGYLLCAVWGGQGGSLLFWAALQTFFTAAVVLWKEEKPRFAVGFLSALQTYFISLVLFHSNPFELSGRTAVRGIGMNPLLLNPFMAVHPPTLFLGFAGFSVPCVFALSALLEKPFREDWMDRERPWILFAWLFLSIGNLLGMVWAYEELGWGGYWGWDPVENASFMPWLTSTALVHIALVKKPAKLFGVLGATLPVLTFCLIVFGTFITRSGVIQSVHAFSDATVGPYLLGLIIFLALLAISLWIYRRRDLVTHEEILGIFKRENLIRATAWILLLSCAFVWLGTMAPLFTELFKGEKVASTPEFFNRWMVPLGLLLFAVLSVCLITSRRSDTSKTDPSSVFDRSKAVPGVVAVLSAVICTVIFGLQGPFPVIAFALFGLTGAAVIRELYCVLKKVTDNAEMTRARHRRMGAQIVHAAVVSLFLGFTGGAFTAESTAVMNEGDTLQIKDYRLRFLGLRDDNDYRRYALFADIEVNDSGKPLGTFSTAKVFYHSHPNQPTSEVAILRSLPQDLFLILGNVDENSAAATIRAVVNPLVSFIWIGGVLLVIGAIVGLSSFSKATSAGAPHLHRKQAAGIAAGVVSAGLFVASFFIAEPIYPFLVLIAAALVVVLRTLGRALRMLTQQEPS